MKIITPWNYDFKKVKSEVNDGISLTIPDQSLSIKQLLERHIQGFDLSQYQRPGVYVSEEEFDQYKPIVSPERDLTDIDEQRMKVQVLKNEVLNEVRKRSKQAKGSEANQGEAGEADGRNEKPKRSEAKRNENKETANKASEPGEA